MYNTRYSCHILMKLEFSRQSSNNPQISHYVKIEQAEAELFHAETTRNSSDQKAFDIC